MSKLGKKLIAAAKSKGIKPWNMCDVCGRLIPLNDFIDGKAQHILIAPDSYGCEETYETLCKEHMENLK
jgi:hypothetical protein